MPDICSEIIPAGRVFGKFVVEQQLLGQGAYSRVFIGRNLETQEEVAVKIISKSSKSYSQCLLRELHALKNLDSPNIVKLLHFAADDINAYLFLEYLPYRSLEDFLTEKGSFDTQTARIIFTQIVQAIEHVHFRNFSHHDLKLDNILINPVTLHVKIIDFGLSLHYPDKRKKVTQFSGTPFYMSPEIIMKRPFDPIKADIWGLGVVLHQLVFGRKPFYARDLRDLRLKISGRYEVPNDAGISTKLADLLQNLFAKDPDMRPTAQQIGTHDWMLDRD